MAASDDTPDPRWTDALTAAALLAVDPAGLGGALLRARSGPQRALWLAQLQALLPAGTPQRRVPLHIADERLLGGLDLAATLHAGRPIAQRGVLTEAHGGLVLLAMAERLAPATAARLAAVLDSGEVQIERDGITLRQPARLGMVALDEGIDDDEQAPAALADRLAFHLVLDELPSRVPVLDAGNSAISPTINAAISPADVLAARARLARVASGDDTARALCQAALALGIPSLRAPWLALRAACVVAALQGHSSVQPEDAALAAKLVLGPRATQRPAAQDATPDDTPDSTPNTPPDNKPDAARADPPPTPPPATPGQANTPPPPPDPGATADTPPADSSTPPQAPSPAALDDLVLQAALSALPAGLLARLKAGLPQRSAAQTGGRAGALQQGGLRGRPLGARRGELRGGARLDLIATLRAAAPWQVLRRREGLVDAARAPATDTTPSQRVLVRREDFHITRRAQRSETTTVFVVDASGSAALARLAEAKGAVELLLADCYVRRDRVALLAFRGSSADLVLPPTRSLVRAKRALAGLPGGGGTPLANALDAATQLTSAIQRRGGTPLVVLLSDARANINRQGAPGRSAALADALAAARQLRATGVSALLVDTSPMPTRPSPDRPHNSPHNGPPTTPPTQARQIADAMAALYLPLPKVDAAGLSAVVRGIGLGAKMR